MKLYYEDFDSIPTNDGVGHTTGHSIYKMVHVLVLSHKSLLVSTKASLQRNSTHCLPEGHQYSSVSRSAILKSFEVLDYF